MKKRILALLVALIMLLLPVLVSCAAQAADGPTEDNKESETAEENNASVENEEVPKTETNEESKEEAKPEPAWKEASKNFEYVPKPDYLYELSKNVEDEAGGFRRSSINEDFAPDRILVSVGYDMRKLELTPEHFSTPTFDAAAAIEKVEKLGNICFKLTLKDSDKQNVLDVIEELAKIRIIDEANPVQYGYTC